MKPVWTNLFGFDRVLKPWHQRVLWPLNAVAYSCGNVACPYPSTLWFTVGAVLGIFGSASAGLIIFYLCSSGTHIFLHWLDHKWSREVSIFLFHKRTLDHCSGRDRLRFLCDCCACSQQQYETIGPSHWCTCFPPTPSTAEMLMHFPPKCVCWNRKSK
jgi:hypothetical protein